MMPTMTDQPTDHGDRPVGDHRPTTIGHAPVPIKAAADRLGITVNAVRQRIKRGTIEGYKTPAGWVVVLDRPTTNRPPPSATDQPTNQRPTTTDQATPVDLAPLAAVISDLTRENRQLAEAATAWQIRAMQAEERLKQLTARHDGDGGGEAGCGDDGGLDGDALDVSSAAPGATETPEPRPITLVPWWRFWERWG